MVYSAKSDDSNTVSQFTRRKTVTITTGGTSTPANYQVKLTITYESEMQADFDDIRFNTKSRAYIDYWIESYVASTSAVVWIELPDAITDPGSDTIRMYYGNSGLSNGRNIVDTFISGFDGDSTGWIEVDPNSHISFVNNRLEFAGLGRNEDAYVYQSIAENNNVVIESTIHITSGDSQSILMIGAMGDIVDDFSNMDNGFGLMQSVSISKCYAWLRIGDTNYPGTGNIIAVGTTYYTRIVRSGNTVTAYWYTDSARTNLAYSDTKTQATLPTNLGYFYLIESWNNGSVLYLTGWMDDSHVRKYIANEPTPTYGTSQHQRRTPQFI